MAELASWQWDPATDVFTWSEPLYSLSGFNLGPPVQSLKQLAQFFTPENREGLIRRMNTTVQSGEAYELELKALRTDRTSLWLAIRGEVVCDSRGQVCRLRGTMHNITARKLAEEARLKHVAIVESSDDAIVSQNLDGTIASWNSGAQHIFGFTETEAVGQPISIIVPPELRDENRSIVHRVESGERVEHYETVRINKEGKHISVSLTMSPVKDSTGRIVGISKIARDITEAKRAAQQLQKSEEMFAKAFRQGPMAITLTDAKTHCYIDVNETFEQFSGYSREELIGRSAL
jgi:PAS domain S-box-containing protein